MDKERSSHKKTKDEASEVSGGQEPAAPAVTTSEPNDNLKGFARAKHYFMTARGKIVLVVLVVLLLAGILFAIPFTRYAILGRFIKKDITVQLTDGSTKKPVSQATAKIDNQQVKSDGEGKAKFKRVSAGKHTVTITKKYFSNASTKFTIGLLDKQKTVDVKMQATGRQVPVSIINTITKAPISGAVISVLDTSATTGKGGKATIVVPANKTQITGTVKLNGYNTANITLTVTEQAVDSNTFAITPSGKVYFLSKRTGIINVMKSNLDGTDQSVVVQGTGQEQEGGTQLLATRDWHYLALKSRRDSKNAKLYLINTSNDSMSVIDGEGADEGADLWPVGWFNNRLIFTATNYNVPSWQPNQTILKSFDAANSSTVILDQNQAVGTNGDDYAKENFGNIHVLDNQIVYYKTWHGTKRVNNVWVHQPLLDGKKATIVYVKPDGSGRQTLKDYTYSPSDNWYINSMAHKTEEVWFAVNVFHTNNTSDTTYLRYKNGNVSPANDLNGALFNRPITTYLVSPSSNNSFWYEPRDGKNTLFVGNQAGDDGTQIASGTEFYPFGWYADDYLLASKNDSELYVMGRSGPVSDALKITDYHKPTYTYPGHGYSYGWYY